MISLLVYPHPENYLWGTLFVFLNYQVCFLGAFISDSGTQANNIHQDSGSDKSHCFLAMNSLIYKVY